MWPSIVCVCVCLLVSNAKLFSCLFSIQRYCLSCSLEKISYMTESSLIYLFAWRVCVCVCVCVCVWSVCTTWEKQTIFMFVAVWWPPCKQTHTYLHIQSLYNTPTFLLPLPLFTRFTKIKRPSDVISTTRTTFFCLLPPQCLSFLLCFFSCLRLSATRWLRLMLWGKWLVCCCIMCVHVCLHVERWRWENLGTCVSALANPKGKQLPLITTNILLMGLICCSYLPKMPWWIISRREDYWGNIAQIQDSSVYHFSAEPIRK